MEVLKYRLNKNSPWQIIAALVGPQGPKGDKGEAFTFDDLTPEQISKLIGPQGPAGPQGPQGNIGPKPVKGVDYWTKPDKDELVADVLNALPAAEGVSV